MRISYRCVAEDVKKIEDKDLFDPKSVYVSLTSHAETFGVEPVRVKWGRAIPDIRGPIIGTNRHDKYRNAIGAHGGSYCVYRGLAVASGALDKVHIGPMYIHAHTLEMGTRKLRSLVVTKAHMDMQEIHEAVRVGRLKPDGKILKDTNQLVITKAAIDPVWYLPGIAKRFHTTESNLRQQIFQETNGMYPELVTRNDLKIFLPPIGGEKPT
ncbi:hypothetical protein DYB38_000063 [Aphanomyces astaci]|uniref:GTP cyclohydrolase N-terminal domain-containing protein n=1 Tax=Aphanomyces astaci TaxID=112090 RepID=A0A397D7X8_APHAT|nr:hypothetical protein DYB38_000063 [Aphanomyces astaci]